MDITKNYNSDDILVDMPLNIFGIDLYSCRTKNYRRFSELSTYLTNSPKHLKLQKSSELLPIIIYLHTVNKNKGDDKSLAKNHKKQQKLFNECIREMCELFEYITLKKVSFTLIDEKGMSIPEYRFIIGDEPQGNKDTRPYINNSNFDIIRKIILKMNILFEPKIYEDSAKGRCTQQIESKVMKAKGKKSNISLGEIINIVSCSTGKSYEQISNQNIVQTHSDFHRCDNNYNALFTAMAKTVDSKYKGVNYSKPVIDEIFRSPYDGLWGNAQNMLGGLE